MSLLFLQLLLYTKERVSSYKHLLMMAGLSLNVFWQGTFTTCRLQLFHVQDTLDCTLGLTFFLEILFLVTK